MEEIKSTMHVYRVEYELSGEDGYKDYIADSSADASNFAYFELAEGEPIEYEESRVIDRGAVGEFKESFIKALWENQQI